MGVNDEQLITLLEVLQTTRVYALNMGETNLTLRGLLALKRLLPHTTITALYIDHTPHKILRQGIYEACWNNLQKRDKLYAATGGRVKKWHHIPEGRKKASQPTTDKTGRRKETSRSLPSEEQPDALALCQCHELLCQCLITVADNRKPLQHCLEIPHSVVSRITVNEELDRSKDITSNSVDSRASPLIGRTAVQSCHKRTRETRGWDSGTSMGRHKKPSIELGDGDSLAAKPSRRTRLQDAGAGEDVDFVPEGR